MSSDSGGMNWQRWRKKKKKKPDSSPPPQSNKGANRYDSAVDVVQCRSDLKGASYSSASTSTSMSSQAMTPEITMDTSHNESSRRDSSSNKRRKKPGKHKVSSNRASSSADQTSGCRTKQHERADISHSFSETARGWDGDSSISKRASTSKMMDGSAGHGPSTSSANMEDSSAKKQPREIPGFYYDEEKKRYFRILPGHSMPSAVTAESIRRKQAEKKRLTVLEGKGGSRGKENNEPRCGRKPANHSLLHILSGRQTGGTTEHHFRRLTQENTVKHIRTRPSCKVTPFPDRYFDGESGYISHFEIDSEQRHVLMVISDDYLSRLWQGEIVSELNPSTGKEETTIKNWSTVNILTTRNCKVTHTSWAQVKDGESMYALYAISGGATTSVQLFKCPSEEDGVSHISYRYESNHETAWTCAWSNSPTLPAYLAIGSMRKAILVDTLSGTKQKLHTCHSDVFSLAFSRTSPILYNGTRRGEVLGIDLRVPSNSHVDMTAVLRHSVSVCSIKLLQDETYLLAGDMAGGIKLWDVRKCAAVQEFKGHHNESHHLPVKLDSSQSVVYAVGQDKYTRLWSLKNGELLRTVPCPSAGHEDSAPTAIYSQGLSCHSQPGLFLGQERQIYWYPMR